jgi:hypothetical protein
METVASTLTDWKQLAHELGKSFEERADQHDKDGKFVFKNYEELKANKYFSAMIQWFHRVGILHASAPCRGSDLAIQKQE